MRIQWNLIFALIFALLVAIFAVVNVDAVPVNYVFGIRELPLILVILGSALVGGLIVGMFGIIRQYKLQRKIKQLDKQVTELNQQLDKEQEALSALQSKPTAEPSTEPGEAEAKTPPEQNVSEKDNPKNEV